MRMEKRLRGALVGAPIDGARPYVMRHVRLEGHLRAQQRGRLRNALFMTGEFKGDRAPEDALHVLGEGVAL